MAEEAIEKVDEQLNCTICFDTYTDPKILQCFHVYCQKCLVKLVVRDQQGQLSLSCPICRQVTPVPARGTASLQSAFHINRLLEILEEKKAKDVLASTEKVESKAKNLPLPKISTCCSEHDGREVELFCETCEELICFKCAIKGGKHHTHDYKDMKESFEKYREAVTQSLEPIEKKMATLAKVLTQLDRQRDAITQQQVAIEAEICENSKQLHKMIEVRQNKLIGQLNHITRTKLKSLATQRDQIETIQAQFGSCLEFTKESLKTGFEQHEVLAMKTGILKQVKELNSAPQPDVFTLTTKADIVFSGSADAAEVCRNHGRVYTPSQSIDPLACVATGRGMKEAVVGEKATAVLKAVTLQGEPCDAATALLSFQAEFVSERVGHNVIGIEHSMEQRGQGQYAITYQPTVKGRHQLHIKADGQHIRGSPFHVTVMLPVEKLGTPIQTWSDLAVPCGIAVNRAGEVMVTECDTGSISVFSASGEKLRSFGRCGSGPGEFTGPTGVTEDGQGNILVADHQNHRIQKVTADGRFLKAVGSYGRKPLQFKFPWGIAYNTSNNKVYVAEYTNHRVQILNSDLSFNTQFGKRGSGRGEFHHPSGVATDSTGRVYVADSGNNRIQVFTEDGEFLGKCGREGAGRGELGCPHGIAVDSSGMMYVNEYDNHRVSVFTPKGRFVTAFGSEGSGPGEFNDPRGLAVDNSGVVYVCDFGNNRVQVF